MKFLITGSHGQLGNELTKMLSTGKSEIGDIPAACLGAEVVAVDVDTLDITDTDAVIAFVCEHKPDVIINCAAMTNVDGCETEVKLAYSVNADGVRNLAVAAEKINAKFINVSTDYVFAGNGNKPYMEWDLCAPNTVYGKSKRLGEEYTLHFCKRSFVVRTSWLYGYIGKNFVKTIRRVAKANDEIKVVCDQRGNPTNANDLAHHILKLAVTEKYGIYHCTGEGECSWHDFAAKIVELSGINCNVKACTTEEYGNKTPRPAYSSLSKLALDCAAGNQMRNWEDALKQYIENVED